jgi:pimeloyl-ACP methyl ester carboxylesterase
MTLSGRYRRIVLVHGACHGKWCWEELAPLLESHGYEVDTLDLPGMGDDPMKPVDVTFSAYVRRVVEVIQAKSGEVVLVGHSLGGHTISQVAEVIDDRIGRLVYLTAILPHSGESPASCLKVIADSGETSGLRAWRASSLEGAQEVDPDLAVDVFYHMCSPEVAQRALKRLRPQPVEPLTAVANLSERWGSVPKTYVLCARDRTISLAAQRRMAARTRGIKVVELDTDHSPFYSDPHGLAKLLEEECR